MAGLIGSLYLFRTAVEHGPRWVIWLLMANALGAWLLVGRWLVRIWRESAPRETTYTVHPEMIVLFLISGSGVVLMGLSVEPILNWLTNLAAR
jgi:NADH:ubiquinone oxidoreductase subunit 2 (subunit N)